MTAMIDHEITSKEQHDITEIYSKITNENIDQEDFIADINSFNDWSGNLIKTLATLKNALTPEAKMLLIRAAILVAASDGTLKEREHKLLFLFAARLGVNKSEFSIELNKFFNINDTNKN